MIEQILEQVNRAVDQFIAKNPSLRNDRDDLVQDIFLKILPRVGGEDFSLRQCRAFAHRATYWTFQTALRRFLNQNRKNTVSISFVGVQTIDQTRRLRRDQEETSAEVTRTGLIADDRIVHWDRVEAITTEYDALVTWLDIETDPEIREELQSQILKKLEFCYE